VIRRLSLAVALTALGLLLMACQSQPALPVLYPAPEFALSDQQGRPVTLADYQGKVWLASFIFTNCTDICPLITNRMLEVQRQAKERRTGGSNFELVSFTVDPQRDTPPVLAAYAESRGVDQSNWRFLTGPAPVVRQVVTGGFRISSTELPNSDQFLHGGQLLLIDRQGQVRAIYSGTDVQLDRVLADVAALAR
jgi:protein SCO1/2